jgi:hypothetical protein
MDFIKKEIEKSDKLIELFNDIKANRKALEYFNLEVKVFKDGVELEP